MQTIYSDNRIVNTKSYKTDESSPSLAAQVENSNGLIKHGYTNDRAEIK